MSLPRHLKVVVCGAGAFGRNHLRIYRELAHSGAPVSLAAIVEPDPASSAALAAEWQVPVFPSIDECIRTVPSLDAASVCVPTSAHHAVASALLRAGIDVLLEKPMAATASEAADLVTTADTCRRILQPGHLERFNPAVTAIHPLLNHPMFFEAHRLSVFSPRSLDIDVVLDLMIHDLDIVLRFARSAVRSIHAVGLPVLSRKTDIANVRIEFESGSVANFTASRVSTEQVRKLRFFQPHQYVSIDYARQDVLLIDVSSGPSEAPALKIEKPAIIPGEPLRLEIESFLQSVLTRTPPIVTADQGAAALSLALAINTAIADHAKRAGLDRFL